MKSREQLNEYHRIWAKDNEPGTGVIGEVPRLADGAVNPVYAIESGLQSIVERVGPYLEATRPKKINKKMVSVSAKGEYLVKRVDIDSEDTVIE